MGKRRFTGEEVATVLIAKKYYPQDRNGSHLKLRYEHPETGEVRNVSVPMCGEISIGTLRNIAANVGHRISMSSVGESTTIGEQ